MKNEGCPKSVLCFQNVYNISTLNLKKNNDIDANISCLNRTNTYCIFELIDLLLLAFRKKSFIICIVIKLNGTNIIRKDGMGGACSECRLEHKLL
jgi:hypothetical protein